MRTRVSDPGLTTEVAMFATFLLGVITATRPQVAVAAGVVMAVLLAARSPLQRLVKEVLSERELRDGLAFAIAALVVLPLLPDRAVDPFGVINPFALWRLAVVMMGLSAAGYMAQRLAGSRRGLILAGLAGGFVSSTATIAAMGRRARETPEVAGQAASAGVASMLTSILYLCLLLAALRPQVLLLVGIPLAVSAACLLAYAVTGLRRDAPPDAPAPTGRAFDLRAVALFVGLVAGFTLISQGLEHSLGDAGVLAGAAATGLADAHAAALSMANMAAAGALSDRTAALGVLIALVANMLVKAPTAWILGGRDYGLRVSLGAVLLAASAFGTAVFTGLVHP
jgi:uncharacterized membrane protein (DUF4010 family)